MEAIFYNPPLPTNRIGDIINEIYLAGVYEPYVLNKKDITVIDCGANIGLFSQYVSPIAKQVYAIEPTPIHFQALSTMLEYNKITNVKPFQYALSNTDGEAIFYTYGNQTMNSLTKIDSYQEPLSSEKVKTIRLDTFVKEQNIDHIDILKVDIEGEEYNVLCGDGFANIADKVDVVIGECHTWANRNPNQLRHSLEEKGFTVTTIPNEAMIFVGVKK